MTLKAIIFDLDNTLIDFMRMKRAASDSAAYAMVDAGLEMECGDACEELFNVYLEVGTESENAFAKFLERHTGKADENILAAGINAYLRTKDSYMCPYPGTMRTLIGLVRRGMLLGIVTDAPRLKAHQRLHAMQLQPFFDAVVCIEDTGERKPSNLPFRRALEELNVTAEEALMVGDWPERDIRGAKKLGMGTAFARYGVMKPGTECEYADHHINSITELLDVVDEIRREESGVKRR